MPVLNRIQAYELYIEAAPLFYRCCRTGERDGASREVSISQSAVTEAVKDLETCLGISLFDRHSRGLEITHKGNLFLRHATKILSDVADAQNTLQDEKVSEPGNLSLGVTSLVAGYVLSELLSRYRRAYPEITVSAIEDNADYLERPGNRF